MSTLTTATPTTDAADREACRLSLRADEEGTSEILVRRIDPISREKAIDTLNEWTEGLTAKVALLNQSTLDLNIALLRPSRDIAELVNMETKLLGEVLELRMMVREGERDLRELYGVREIPRMDPPTLMAMVKTCPICGGTFPSLLPDGGTEICGECLEGEAMTTVKLELREGGVYGYKGYLYVARKNDDTEGAEDVAYSYALWPAEVDPSRERDGSRWTQGIEPTLFVDTDDTLYEFCSLGNFGHITDLTDTGLTARIPSGATQ